MTGPEKSTQQLAQIYLLNPPWSGRVGDGGSECR
jgi:hypothetical protein